MHGIVTINKINRENAEALEILERHGQYETANLLRQNSGVTEAAPSTEAQKAIRHITAPTHG